MNIAILLDDLKLNLTCDRYVKSVWQFLKESSNNGPSSTDERKFCNHLPFNFTNVLDSCIKKLRHSIREQEDECLTSIDYKYLIALIYYGLQCENYAENEPIRAAQIYILINTIEIDHVKCILQNTTMQNKLFHKSIDVINHHLLSDFEIDHEFLIDFSNYLAIHAINTNLEKVIQILGKTSESKSNQVFKDFEYTTTSNKSFLSFYSMQLLVLNTSYEESKKKEIVMLIAIELMNSLCKNFALDFAEHLIYVNNTKKFFQMVLKDYLNCDWFMNLFKELCKLYYDKSVFIQFICDLSKEFFDNLTKTLISKLASDHSCKLQNVLLEILQVLPSNKEQSQNIAIPKLIIKNIILLVGHTQEDIKTAAMKSLAKIIILKDPIVEGIIQNFIMADPLTENMNAATMFEILKKTDGDTMKKKNFYKSFINVNCHIFMKCPEHLTDDRIKHLELICIEASSVEFKQCIPMLLQMLMNSPETKVIRLVLNILVHHASCATSSTASYYLKKLFEILYDTANEDESSKIPMDIVNMLISPIYDYKSIFKKISSINLFNEHFLRRLFHKISLNEPDLWKIVNNVLDFVRCTSYPRYIYSYFRRCVAEHLFLLSYCGDMLSSFNKICKYILESHKDVENDLEFMINLEDYLSKSIQVHNVPIVHIPIVFQTLKNLHRHNKRTWEPIDDLFKDLDNGLHDALVDIKTAKNFERELVYIGEMILLFDYKVNDRNLDLLQQRLVNWRSLFYIPTIWSALIVLFGKICLKQQKHIDSCNEALQKALEYGDRKVKYAAVAVLYDFCNILMQRFETWQPHLETLLQSDDDFIRYEIEKLILQLNKNGHIRMKYNPTFKKLRDNLESTQKIKKYSKKGNPPVNS